MKADAYKSGNVSASSTSNSTEVRNLLSHGSSYSSTDTIDQPVNVVEEKPSLDVKSCYGKVQICDNIYTKTYKKRQSYGRRHTTFRNSDSLPSTIVFKSKRSHQKEVDGRKSVVSTQQARKTVCLKSTKPLSIAKQLVEKAKGEKRWQLQRKGNNDTNSRSVSRFGRTVKKKVLDYDDFTSPCRKRSLQDGKALVGRVFKNEEGTRKSITTGSHSLFLVNIYLAF